MEFGNGRNSNVMGALYVHWKDKKMGAAEFKVGSGFDDKDRKNWKKLFPKGKIITVKYWEINKSSKKPRFPIYMRLTPQE